jgi:hypothetical protein
MAIGGDHKKVIDETVGKNDEIGDRGVSRDARRGARLPAMRQIYVRARGRVLEHDAEKCEAVFTDVDLRFADADLRFGRHHALTY